MRSIAACYSDHAIKVSDSYCSGHSNHACTSQNTVPSIQKSVTCIYKSKLSSQKQILITITWSKQSFTGQQGPNITISNHPSSIFNYKSNSCHLRKSKGSSKFELGKLSIEVLWDFSSAQYDLDPGPEPISGFYLIVLVDSEISLVLGSIDPEEEKQLITQGAEIAKFTLISRSAYFTGNTLYSTRAQFCEAGITHDITIKCNKEHEGSKSVVLSVFMDKKNVILVKRLKWNFRGNQTIFVDGLLVDMMWDVHDWFFNECSGYGVFLFRTRSGLDCRLWLQEKNLEFKEDQPDEKAEFSLLICAYKNPY